MGRKSKFNWKEEISNIGVYVADGKTLEEIGEIYGVTKQRMYQVFEKYGINTLCRIKKNYLKNKEPKYYWLNRILTSKNISKENRYRILDEIDIPETCPCLGFKLNYDGTGLMGWSRTDDSPSLDRIDSSKGYELENLQIISWRANRIKNDSTPEELMKIAVYMTTLK